MRGESKSFSAAIEDTTLAGLAVELGREELGGDLKVRLVSEKAFSQVMGGQPSALRGEASLSQRNTHFLRQEERKKEKRHQNVKDRAGKEMALQDLGATGPLESQDEDDR